MDINVFKELSHSGKSSVITGAEANESDHLCSRSTTHTEGTQGPQPRVTPPTRHIYLSGAYLPAPVFEDIYWKSYKYIRERTVRMH